MTTCCKFPLQPIFTPNRHVKSFLELINNFFILSGLLLSAFNALYKFGLLNLLYMILFMKISSCGRILVLLFELLLFSNSLSLFQVISLYSLNKISPKVFSAFLLRNFLWWYPLIKLFILGGNKSSKNLVFVWRRILCMSLYDWSTEFVFKILWKIFFIKFARLSWFNNIFSKFKNKTFLFISVMYCSSIWLFVI